MKTKKVLLFFMVLALFCGCGNGRSGEKGIEFDRSFYERADFQAISIQEGIESFALNEDGMIFCSGADAKLYVYAKDGGDKEEIPSSSFYGNICVDGKNVYAYDYDQSAIVQLTDNGEISSENIKVIQNSISLHTIRNMVATNGKIYVLAIPFTADNLGETPDFNRNSVIFKTIDIGDHLTKMVKVGSNKCNELLEGWRVLPFPKFQSDSEKITVGVTYAFVNPYSKQQEAATEYLEVILENQTNIIERPVFFQEDMEYYEQYYDTSILAFQDIYAIFKDADVFCGHSWDLSTEYITEYQRGLISFDEAIERRQRRAVTGLYE